MERIVCFSHGQESGPWGTKISVLADVARGRGWTAESLDYQGIPEPDIRANELIEWCQRQAAPAALVGSSMGGFVALSAASAVESRGLFLMAPALYVDGYKDLLPKALPACPTTIVHGWHDTVIPWEDSVQYAAAHQSRLLLVDGDHRLTVNLAEISVLFGRFLDELDQTGEGGQI